MIKSEAIKNQGKRSILITGTSSGIGFQLASDLARQGNIVFAAVRKDDDIDRLGAIDNVIPVKMDVTKPQQVRDAVRFIARRGNGLYGLVNNAGIGALGYFSTWSDADMLEIFDINVFGPHRVTNAFLDMIIESQGRVVNIGSQGGTITSKLYGPYTMTKHALEAYTVALDLELRPFGVRVSIVQPGGILSKVGANSMAGNIRRLKKAKLPFRDEARQILAALKQPPDGNEEGDESETNRKPSSPEIVSLAVRDALFSERPKLRYLVGTKWEGDRVIKALIVKLLDENDNPVHRYSREYLINLLDEHIAAKMAAGASE